MGDPQKQQGSSKAVLGPSLLPGVLLLQASQQLHVECPLFREKGASTVNDSWPQMQQHNGECLLVMVGMVPHICSRI